MDQYEIWDPNRFGSLTPTLDRIMSDEFKAMKSKSIKWNHDIGYVPGELRDRVLELLSLLRRSTNMGDMWKYVNEWTSKATASYEFVIADKIRGKLSLVMTGDILPTFDSGEMPNFLASDRTDLRDYLRVLQKFLLHVHPKYRRSNEKMKFVYSPEIKSAGIRIKGTHTTKVKILSAHLLVHEYGHYIRDNNSEVFSLCKEFFKARTKDDPNGVVKVEDYRTIKDKFVDEYAGRVYGWESDPEGAGEEIFSTGLEQMLGKWRRRNFFVRDPQHFLLVLAVMRGQV